MNYFADSAWDYVAKKVNAVQVAGGSRRLLMTVPRLPEQPTLALADTFASHCIAQDVALTFKVAEAVSRCWSASAKETAALHGWLDDEGTLTRWRHEAPAAGRTTLVVLCGADTVTDAGSLADFHRCDPDTVWREQMKCSFRGWVHARLTAVGLPEDGADLRDFDRLLVPLLEHGKADLVSVGEWLAKVDLNGLNSVREVQKALLSQMGPFQLPRFSGFPLGRKQASLGPYIDKANAFFSYTMFLEPREREKAVKAIRAMEAAMVDGDDVGVSLEGTEVIGPYYDAKAFLEGLRNYIDNEDGQDRTQLMACDFVTVIDKVLKFRRRGDPRPRKESLRRLSGSPVEVVLHAVWQTMHEWARDRDCSETQVAQISIVGDRFRHDYENTGDEEEADAAIDRAEQARRYLLRLLGGVDDLVKTRLALPRETGENVVVECTLAGNDVTCTYAKTAEPQLEFSVQLTLSGRTLPFRRKFAWRLPEIQPYRLAEAMVGWAKEALEREPGTWTLPVFHLPYYEELLRAADDEETRRILLHCLRDAEPGEANVSNELSREWLASHDPLLPQIKNLAEKYALFLRAAGDGGLHAALFGNEWTELRQAYAAACRRVLEDESAAESQMTAMLLRSCLVVKRRGREGGPAWATEPFESSALATVLHPAVLEMLEAQVVFLFSCFNAAAVREQKQEDRRTAFADKTWTGYVDLASIHTPLVGLLYNEDLNLDTNVRGQDLIHRIGSPADTVGSLSTRLLRRYDNGLDDEEVPDAEMFRESRESRLLFRLMMDYFRLHPHARDGLTLAVIRNEDIQPVIAAVHQYVKTLADKRDARYYVLSPTRRKPYALGVTVFTETGDDAGVSRWIEQWRERWEAAETETKFEAYRSCRFSVAHRIVETRQLLGFQRLIADSFEADIAVLYDFVGAGHGGNRFAEVTPFDVRGRTLKFPILEKSCCAVRHPTDSYKRSRVISNRQFTLSTVHAQVMHRLKNPGVQPGREFVVLGVGDFAPWRPVVDALHAKAEWVICIDPSMDERLVRKPAGGATKEREIIGFGSGVGSHGEANFTVSTEQFSLADVQARLAASVREVYATAGWSEEDWWGVASGVLREACQLSGLSLVRATGVGHYVRDFMAYALTRRMLRQTGTLLCDTMVSLDAYRHWFDLAESERRPDLLWLTAWLDADNRVCVRAHLIECKVARQSEQHLLNARVQVTNGLRVLMPAFAPRAAGDHALAEDNRPDQRYWWLQLHRLVASKAEIESSRQADVLSALERLAEGDYAIEWAGSVFAFWSDDPSEHPVRAGAWQVSDVESVTADIYVMGSEFVRELGLGRRVSKTWEEWEASARKPGTNVCDALNDLEPSTEVDDDEDVMPSHEEEEQEADEDTPSEHDVPEEGAEIGTGDGDPFESNGPVSVESAPVSPLPVKLTSGEHATTDVATLAPVEAGTPQPIVARAPHIPDRVLLGKTIGGGKPVYWEFGHRELANRHMLVFGTSGMGKTYAIQCILSELGRLCQNSLILDYTDGFIPSKLEETTKRALKPEQHFIQHEPLPIEPFKAHISEEAGITFKDTHITIAKRVAAIFKNVYELGNQQFPILIDAINDGLQGCGDQFRLDAVLDVLHSYIDDGIHANASVRTTISKLKPFVQSNPFSSAESGIGWDAILADAAARCHVFQFHKVDRHSARALIEFVLWDLYAFVSTFGNKDTPRVVVLDEVQNLDLGPDAPVAKYLTEGRKHGLALLTATQTVKGVGGVSDARVSRLFMAEQKLFFKPTENEMREHAQLLHNAISTVSVQEWTARLASLELGQCWSLGRAVNEATGRLSLQAQRIKITRLEERGFDA